MGLNMTSDSHYKKRGGMQPTEFALENQLNGPEFNIVKYIYRYPWKHRPYRDLRKARDFINVLIENLEMIMEQHDTGSTWNEHDRNDYLREIKKVPESMVNPHSDLPAVADKWGWLDKPGLNP